MKRLEDTTINKELKNLNNWNHIENSIEKEFVFQNFPQALDFIVQVGVVSEKMNHHPEIYNVYNKVKLRLTTHDYNGVTQKDIDLAVAIETIP
jgi:4a-hydroxytetrahydrobiopterin dehydratase